jgi:hypothetical protein
MERKNMTKVYIVAGASSCGKSSVIRHICGSTSVRKEIEDIIKLKIKNNVLLNTFCKSRSLQEAGIYPKDVKNHIQKFLQKKKLQGYDAVLVALRTDVMHHRAPTLDMPPADAYINEFVSFGWQIEKIVDIVSSLQAYCQQNNHQYQSFQVINSSYSGAQAYPSVKQSYTITNQLYDGLNPLCPDVKTFFGFI